MSIDVFHQSDHTYFCQYSPKCHLVHQALSHSAPTWWTVQTSAIQSVLTTQFCVMFLLKSVGKAEMNMQWKPGFHSTGNYYFGLRLSHLLLSATEQLSLTLQSVDTVQASKLALEGWYFYDQVLESAKHFTDEPTLPCCSKQPRWLMMEKQTTGLRPTSSSYILSNCWSLSWWAYSSFPTDKWYACVAASLSFTGCSQRNTWHYV